MITHIAFYIIYQFQSIILVPCFRAIDLGQSVTSYSDVRGKLTSAVLQFKATLIYIVKSKLGHVGTGEGGGKVGRINFEQSIKQTVNKTIKRSI